MKTKLQILGLLLAFTAFTRVSNASVLNLPVTNLNESHINAILGTPGNFSSASSVNLTNIPSTTDNSQSLLATQGYHHSSSSGGDDDGIKGKNIIYVGVGFVSITGVLTSAYTSAGYTNSSIPPITLAYERGISAQFGIGLQVEYTSFTLSLNNQTNSFYPNTTYSDKLTLTGIGFGIVGTYSFLTNKRIDPYFGFGVGYEIFNAGWSTTDPHAGSNIYAGQDGNVNPGSISGGLPWFNIFVGCRFFFTDNIGAYVDMGWHGLVGGIINVGLAFKF